MAEFGGCSRRSGRCPPDCPAKEHHEQVVVVVSAMGKTTDELLGLARQLSKEPSPLSWICSLLRGAAIFGPVGDGFTVKLAAL